MPRLLYHLLRPAAAIDSENSWETAKRERELSQLKKQLADAIASQQYEECAKLRDRIQELEGNGDEQQ